MKAYKLPFLLITAFFTTEVYSQISKELATEVFNTNNTRQLLGRPTQLQNDLIESLFPYGSLSNKKRGQLFNKIKTITQPSRLNNKIIEKLAVALTQQEAKSLISWANSTLGKQLLLEQEFLNYPNAQATWSKRMSALAKDRKKVDEADKVNQLTISTDNTYIQALYSVLTTKGLKSIHSRPNITPKHFSALQDWVVEKYGEDLGQNSYDGSLAMTLFRIRNLKTDEINRYISHLKTGSSIKYFEAIYSSLEEVLLHEIAPEIFTLNYETYPTINPAYRIQVDE